MRIQIDGRHNNITNTELRSAAQFFARQLFTDATNKKIQLSVEFENLGSTAFNGFCEYCDRKDRPRQFLIGIRKTLPRKTALKVLAHEMVHVWQYASGHMYDIDMHNGAEGTKWRGRKFNADRLEYWDYPWEIDAFGREVGLYARYQIWSDYRARMRKQAKARSKNK